MEEYDANPDALDFVSDDENNDDKNDEVFDELPEFLDTKMG